MVMDYCVAGQIYVPEYRTVVAATGDHGRIRLSDAEVTIVVANAYLEHLRTSVTRTTGDIKN